MSIIWLLIVLLVVATTWNYCIPAIERYKKEQKGNTTSTSENDTQNTFTKTHDTTQHNMGAGPWVPSLENWGGGLKSLCRHYLFLSNFSSGGSRGVPRVPRNPPFCASAEGLRKHVCPDVYMYTCHQYHVSGTPLFEILDPPLFSQ